MENHNLNNNYIHKISLVNNEGEAPTSIENGYFIFTLMPSLRCSLNCPHCYLSLEQRRNSALMKLEEISIACDKIHDYYLNQKIKNKLIVCYWYGGEPTEMGIEYFKSAIEIINNKFNSINGYIVKHTILTSLITIDQNVWFNFFKTHCENHFQTSFDGFMRGKTYVKKWEEKIKLANMAGLRIGTITVVNNEILKLGAKQTLDYLVSLNIKEASFLPFMLNEQNIGQKYDKYAPTMNNYSQFMIEVSNLYFENKKNNVIQPEIGQLSFILHQKDSGDLSNIASQTLFLLPNGDFVLPDYSDGYKEYMKVFGNILKNDFKTILTSKNRRDYLRRQVMRNNNPECLVCEHADKCVMEFFKPNKIGDDCFGGKKYVEWLTNYVAKNNIKMQHNKLY